MMPNKKDILSSLNSTNERLILRFVYAVASRCKYKFEKSSSVLKQDGLRTLKIS